MEKANGFLDQMLKYLFISLFKRYKKEIGIPINYILIILIGRVIERLGRRSSFRAKIREK